MIKLKILRFIIGFGHLDALPKIQVDLKIEVSKSNVNS